MIQRARFLQSIDQQFKIHSVCALLGPRQVGKTTLARQYAAAYHTGTGVRFFDLEKPLDLERLAHPMLALSAEPEKLLVIDEVQLKPDLFGVLRVLIDESPIKRKILILGSASRDLIQQSSETLAGRIGFVELPPFGLRDYHDQKTLFVRGGFPVSLLADNNEQSFLWRQNYIRTFLERDIPNLGFSIPPQQLRRFWLMLCHYHGQIFNASELSRSLGVSDHTVRRYLDILCGTFMVRMLTPWFENISKRQVKSPKIYFRDTGILHGLLSIENMDMLETHPRLGSFWEGFALEEVIKQFGLAPEECFFWATHADAELDLFVLLKGKRIGFEFKYADVPKVTKSMHSALASLSLDALFVVYPGAEKFELADRVTAVPLAQIATLSL